jgi:type IV secretion system protein VirB5
MRIIRKGAAFAALVLVGSFASGGAFAQMPVTITSTVPGTTFHLEDIAKYAEQIDQMKAEVTQLQNTYNSLTGTRGIGQLFQNPSLVNMLPGNWQGVYNQAANGGFSGITGSVQSIISAEQGLQNGTIAQGGQAVMNRQFQTAAYDKAMGEEAYQSSMQRLNNIQGLMGQINSSTDPKAIADLQARIQGEQMAIQNEQTKVQLMSQLQQSEDRLVEAQRDQIGQRALNASNTAIPSIGN